MSQLFLPFPNNIIGNLYSEEDFLLLTENSAAFSFLQKFFNQKTFSQSQFNSLILKSTPAAGKTHLMHIFARKFGADFLNKDEIVDLNPSRFFSANRFYILEDISETREELVLHLINSAFEAKAFLVLTSELYWQFQLRDLVSRLKNIFSVEIKNPGPDSIKQLLANGLSRRQIKVSSRVINFIAKNIDRTYQSCFYAVKLVELHCQESGRNIDLKKIKTLLPKLKESNNR